MMNEREPAVRCDICRRNPAVIRFAEIRKGTMSVRNICQDCARTTGIAGQLDRTIAAVGGAISDAMAALARDHGGAQACPACGMTLDQFRRHGHLGCERCYDSFAAVLLPLLDRLQELAGQPEQDPAAAGEQQRRDNRRQALAQRLEEAVAAEEYELAARLRDQLKELAAVAAE
ncbi:MAG: UvrB/UvrC motif-containing protein [Candidatus Edwardsbacteria bacterium]|nr:UvrB/UvrC motif-containing protein [Candidatus Edwardsbacteria bacterium]